MRKEIYKMIFMSGIKSECVKTLRDIVTNNDAETKAYFVDKYVTDSQNYLKLADDYEFLKNYHDTLERLMNRLDDQDNLDHLLDNWQNLKGLMKGIRELQTKWDNKEITTGEERELVQLKNELGEEIKAIRHDSPIVEEIHELQAKKEEIEKKHKVEADHQPEVPYCWTGFVNDMLLHKYIEIDAENRDVKFSDQFKEFYLEEYNEMYKNHKDDE